MNACRCGCGKWVPKTYARGHNLKCGTYLGREGKTTPHATIRPIHEDLIWAAGFLEGEGCFRMHRHSQVVTAVQVNQEPILRIQRMFGGKIFPRPADKPTHNPKGMWYISGSRARGVMMTLYSLMSLRRRNQILRGLGLNDKQQDCSSFLLT